MSPESSSLNDLTIKSDLSNDLISNSSSIAYLTNQTTNSWRSIDASTCLITNDSFFKANNYLFQKKNNIIKNESIYEDNNLASYSMDSSHNSNSLDYAWKYSIINQLCERFENEMSAFKGKYLKVNENGTWLKSASVMYMSNENLITNLMNLDLNLNSLNNLQTNLVYQVNSYLLPNSTGFKYGKIDFIKCHLELERDGSDAVHTQSGSLLIRFVEENRRGKTTNKTSVVSLDEIILVDQCANPANFPYSNILFVYVTKYLFIFAMEDEKEMNEWFVTLQVACNCLNNLNDSVFSPIYKPDCLLITVYGQAYAGYLLNDRSIQNKRNKLKQKLEQNQQAQRNLKYKLFKFKEIDKGNDKQMKLDDEDKNETEQTAEQILKELKEQEIKLNKLFEELLIKSGHCMNQNDKNDKIYFMHLGSGNFKQLAYTSTGVIYALTENGTPMVHSTIVGGSIYKNHLPNSNLNFLTDTLVYEIYENQRYEIEFRSSFFNLNLI